MEKYLDDFEAVNEKNDELTNFLNEIDNDFNIGELDKFGKKFRSLKTEIDNFF